MDNIIEYIKLMVSRIASMRFFLRNEENYLNIYSLNYVIVIKLGLIHVYHGLFNKF